jgi:hypothetical protein
MMDFSQHHEQKQLKKCYFPSALANTLFHKREIEREIKAKHKIPPCITFWLCNEELYDG